MPQVLEPQAAVNRQISKVKLAKNGGVEVEFEQTTTIMVDGKPLEFYADVPYKGRSLPHPDLLHAFELLRGHLAIICSQLDGKKPDLQKIEHDELFMALFKVTGVSIGGSGESEGVTLVGNKKIKRGQLNLVSSFTKYYDENDLYEYADELMHLVNHVVDEANLYVDGKIAPDAQGKLEFDSSKNDEPE
jgi:hypothetical protein